MCSLIRRTACLRGTLANKGSPFAAFASASAPPSPSPPKALWNLSAYKGNSDDVLDPSRREAVIALNYQLPQNLVKYWNTSGVKIAADGGLRWLHASSKSLVPHFVVGDFDSTPPALLEEYKNLGSRIIDGSHDQDSTDLEKALLVLEVDEVSKGVQHDRILILGGLGGNLSHQFANLNAMFKHHRRNIVLIGTDNVAVLVSPSRPTEISFYESESKPTFCSLIPLGRRAREVKTSGLKWNLDGDVLEFGHLVSTSNEFNGSTVTITTSDPFLFLVDLKH